MGSRLVGHRVQVPAQVGRGAGVPVGAPGATQDEDRAAEPHPHEQGHVAFSFPGPPELGLGRASDRRAQGAFPDWIGVYGVFQRHDGGNPGAFTVRVSGPSGTCQGALVSNGGSGTGTAGVIEFGNASFSVVDTAGSATDSAAALDVSSEQPGT